MKTHLETAHAYGVQQALKQAGYSSAEEVIKEAQGLGLVHMPSAGSAGIHPLLAALGLAAPAAVAGGLTGALTAGEGHRMEGAGLGALGGGAGGLIGGGAGMLLGAQRAGKRSMGRSNQDLDAALRGDAHGGMDFAAREQARAAMRAEAPRAMVGGYGAGGLAGGGLAGLLARDSE